VRIDATDAAARAVERVRASGRDDLVIVLSSGCCDSTAPFLYDHYIPEPGSEPVGELNGVRVLAPAWLARLYAGDETLVLDAEEDVVEDSFSLETEHGMRLVLRAAVRR